MSISSSSVKIQDFKQNNFASLNNYESLFLKRRRGVSKNGEKRKKRQNGKKKQLLQKISTYEVLDAEMQKRKRRLTLREEISAQAQCKSNASDE